MEVTIERILPGGFGLAHAEGRTIMVALAAPGDRLRIRVDRVKGNVSFASIEEIITPSPHRVEPPCPYFGRCGGCDFQQMNYRAQLDAKAEMIRDCLRRLARIENIPDFQVTTAPDPWHYRLRAQWQYDAIRQRLGYFERGSRNVCDVAQCAVLAPPLQSTFESLRALMTAGSLPDARDFRAAAGNEGVSISPPVHCVSPTMGEDSILDSSVVRDISRTIQGECYRFNAESFFQANDGLLPALVEAALGDARGRTALELYCGVGLFTLPLARRFSRVIGVESDQAAANYARINLANAELKNASTSTARVSEWLKHSGLERGTPDLVLLDPPRTGAEPGVIAGIVSLEPRRISYVSCDPATLARDLKDLLASGYHLASITAFDMFPQTHHVETVVHLGRSEE